MYSWEGVIMYSSTENWDMLRKQSLFTFNLAGQRFVGIKS
jgi:hypothetical protein